MRWMVPWTVVVPAVVIALGAAAYAFGSTTPGATPAPESVPSSLVVPDRLEQERAAREEDRTAQQEAKSALEDTGAAEPLTADAEPDDPVQPAVEVAPPASALEQERNARKTERTREQLELEAKQALSSVKVTMYSTAWCGVCRRARSWLQASGIRFREFDVEQNEAASWRMHQLNPKGGVPTIDVDGEVLVGFSPESMSQLLGRAVEKRLARR